MTMMSFALFGSPSPADVGSTLWAVLLFFGAVLGHFVLAMALHNWLYGLGMPRRLVHLMQLTIGLILLTGPILRWSWLTATICVRCSTFFLRIRDDSCWLAT